MKAKITNLGSNPGLSKFGQGVVALVVVVAIVATVFILQWAESFARHHFDVRTEQPTHLFRTPELHPYAPKTDRPQRHGESVP